MVSQKYTFTIFLESSKSLNHNKIQDGRWNVLKFVIEVINSDLNMPILPKIQISEQMDFFNPMK